MSEQGWQNFLAADGVDDWVVLHGGASAVYDVGSLRAAADLAQHIARELTADIAGLTLTIAGDRLAVRLTRDLWHLEHEHIAMARQISRIAHEHRANPERSAVQELQVAIAAQPDAVDVEFWRAVLGYSPASDDNAIDPLGRSSTVWMQELDASRDLRHAMHLDVSLAREEAEKRVAAAVAAGGELIVASDAPASWILSDRAGNRVCIAAWPDGAVSGDALEATTD